MASVHKVSIYQQARDKIETDISGIIQCLNQKKESLFREIIILENEFYSKQQQKQNSVKKLESLKARTEEELGDNLLSEIQGRLTLELQTGIDKIRLETNSTVDYTIQIDWGDKLNVVRERIKEFSIKTVPNTVSYATHPKNVSLSKKAPKKKSKQKPFSGYYARDAEPRNNWTRWPDQDLGEVIRKERNRGDVSWTGPYRRDINRRDETWGDDTW